MCYGPEARPPLPPIAGGAGLAGAGELVLEAGDGTRLAAYGARAAVAEAPGVVIFPDVRGLHPFYRELAERFAEAGVHATAFDYFGRTAGTGARDDDFDAMAHVRRTTPEQVALDAAAAIAHVRSPDGGAAVRTYTVGFCFGGRASFNEAAAGQGLDGVIGFYGRVQRADEDDRAAPVERAASYACPVLGLFGGADQAVPAEAVEAFREALVAAGVEEEIVVYPEAPHSFFDRHAVEHAEASADAWRRILAFVGATA
ncbi:MAG TPA: dienelactone hydrolase family protein [Actinomycetota bacterium]|nr:dienelactone hydrolase family protein [Actinomycetota bacterium]